MVGDQGLPGVRVQDGEREGKKNLSAHVHMCARTVSKVHNAVSLFSDLSKTGGRGKKKNIATRTPILAVIGFADS